MQLGISVTPADDQPPLLDPYALRALRPDLVRLVLTDPPAVDTWIAVAAARSLRVLWCVPIEAGGIRTWHRALKALALAPCTAGIELGAQVPARTPLDYAASALHAARTIAVYGGGAFHRDRLPILVNAGAADLVWTRTLVGILAGDADARTLITGLSVGLMLDRSVSLAAAAVRRFAMRIERAGDWRLALTRVSCPVVAPLDAASRLREAARDLAGGLRPHWRRTIDTETRDRWLVQALEFAEVNATHLVIETYAALMQRGERWPFYVDASGRADAIWYRLMIRARKRQVPAALVYASAADREVTP